jgi:MscS family membrane protein
MDNLFETWTSSIGIELWVGQAFLIILAVLLLEFLYRRFVNRIRQLAERTEHLWDDAIVYAGLRPVSLLIWTEGLIFAARVASPHTHVIVLDAALLNIIQQLMLVVCATWFFFRLVTGAEQAFVAERRKKDEDVDITTVQAVGRIFRIALLLTGTLTALSVLNIPISGFLAAGGVGGIAIGLAARDLLANFFGGFMVFMDRPFSVGDWVRSPDRAIEGVVEKIGWRMTTIRKFDKRPMYVPNATFASITVENPSRMTHRRIFEHIGVRYDDFAVIKNIVDDIRQYILNHDALDESQTTMVQFDQYGPHSLDIMIYCFTKTVVWTEYHEVREDVLIGIGNVIAQHGAEIAFPTRTLKLEADEPLSRETGQIVGSE